MHSEMKSSAPLLGYGQGLAQQDLPVCPQEFLSVTPIENYAGVCFWNCLHISVWNPAKRCGP